MDSATKLTILKQHIDLKNESLRAAQKLRDDGDLSSSEYDALVKDIQDEFNSKKQALLLSNENVSVGTGITSKPVNLSERLTLQQNKPANISTSTSYFQHGDKFRGSTTESASLSSMDISIAANQITENSAHNNLIQKTIPPTMYDLPLYPCIYPHCKQFASHSSSLNMIQSKKYCAKHKEENMGKIYKRCNFINCHQCALFRFEDNSSNPDVYCAQHRQQGMITIYEMCESRDCQLIANYRLASDLFARFCVTHSTPGMERVYFKLGDNMEKSVMNKEQTVKLTLASLYRCAIAHYFFTQCEPCIVPQDTAPSELTSSQQSLLHTYPSQSQAGKPTHPSATKPKTGSERGRGRPRLSSLPNSQSTPCDVMGCTATSALPIFVGHKNRICRFCRIHMKMVINKNVKISHKRGQKPYIHQTPGVEEAKSSRDAAGNIHYESDCDAVRYTVGRYCAIHRSPGMNILSSGKCMDPSCSIRPTYLMPTPERSKMNYPSFYTDFRPQPSRDITTLFQPPPPSPPARLLLQTSSSDQKR